MLISILAECKARCTHAFSLFSAKPQSSCFRRASLLHILSNFCIMMFLEPFFLRLCMRSEALFMPPLNTQRFRVLPCYRDSWNWATLKWWREKLSGVPQVFEKPDKHWHMPHSLLGKMPRPGKSPNSDSPTRICCLHDPYQIRSTLILGIIVLIVSVNPLIEWILQNEAGLKRSGSSLPCINAVKMLNNRS